MLKFLICLIEFQVNYPLILFLYFYLITIYPRKEELSYEYQLTLEIDNLWFMNFKLIPIYERPLLNLKYNKEILRIIGKNDSNTKIKLESYLSKILKKELSITDNRPNSLLIKVTDSFRAKKISFGLMINEISLNQLELILIFKKAIFEEFMDFNQDLVHYLKEEVLDKIFLDLLIVEYYKTTL